MKLFYSIPSKDSERILSCGFSSADYRDGEAVIDEKKVNCLIAYIVPGDVVIPEGNILLEIDMEAESVCVAEGAFKTAEDSDAQKLYEESFVRLSDYRFGDYARPECLITSSLLPEQIQRYDGRRGFPLVYERSESLYEEKTFHKFCEKYGDIRMYGMRCCCEALHKAGKMSKKRSGVNLVFTDLKTGERFVIPGK